MTPNHPPISTQARIADLVRRTLGCQVDACEPLPGGLDVRRFFRVTLSGISEPTRLIARVEGRGEAPPIDPPLEPIRALFEREGLPVPASYAADNGIDLLEDLGQDSLEALASRVDSKRRRALYGEACALLPRLQAITSPSPPLAPFERSLDADLIALKARKWIEWTLPLTLGRSPTQREQTVVGRGFEFIAAVCKRAPQRLAHRDFKAANLHLRAASRNRSAELCMIDLQGAFQAPPEYDLVCLLQDSQVRIPQEEVIALREGVRTKLPDPIDPEVFARRFDLLTLIRVAKDISHYLRAARQLGDQRYLRFVPNGLANLRGAAERALLRDAELREMGELILSFPVRFSADRKAISGGG